MSWSPESRCMACNSEYESLTDPDAKKQESWERSPADHSRPWLQARSDVVPLHACRSSEDTMTATTDHYLCIDLHKRQAQVAVLDDEGKSLKRSASVPEAAVFDYVIDLSDSRPALVSFV